MADRHGVGVQTFSCSMCDYRAKEKGNLKKHMANRHGVGVQTFSCSMCDYRAKETGRLQRHMARRHGVDVQESDRAIHCKKCPSSDDVPQLAQPQARSPDRAIEAMIDESALVLARELDPPSPKRRRAQA